MGGTLEAVNQLVERLEAPAWLGFTAIGCIVLIGSTWIWVGAGDALALGAAGLTAVSGVGAAWQRRALDRLPLELSEQAAVWEGLAGPEVTVRARLGRGRGVDSVVARAWMDDVELRVLVHPGRAVGRFQAVITGLPSWHVARELRVQLWVQAEGREWVVERVYTPDQRKIGRFAPGFTVSGGLGFEPGSWDRLG